MSTSNATRTKEHATQKGVVGARALRLVESRAGSREGDHVARIGPEEREDSWLLTFLLIAFVIAVVRVVYAVHHEPAFGADASVALVFVLIVPLLLRESVINFVGRLLRRLASARSHERESR